MNRSIHLLKYSLLILTFSLSLSSCYAQHYFPDIRNNAEGYLDSIKQEGEINAKDNKFEELYKQYPRALTSDVEIKSLLKRLSKTRWAGSDLEKIYQDALGLEKEWGQHNYGDIADSIYYRRKTLEDIHRLIECRDNMQAIVASQSLSIKDMTLFREELKDLNYIDSTALTRNLVPELNKLHVFKSKRKALATYFLSSLYLKKEEQLQNRLHLLQNEDFKDYPYLNTLFLETKEVKGNLQALLSIYNILPYKFELSKDLEALVQLLAILDKQNEDFASLLRNGKFATSYLLSNSNDADLRLKYLSPKMDKKDLFKVLYESEFPLEQQSTLTKDIIQVLHEINFKQDELKDLGVSDFKSILIKVLEKQVYANLLIPQLSK